INRLGFVLKGLLGELYVHINQEGLYIATSARWPGCSKQYRCIPASGLYRKRPSAPSIPFLCIGQRDAGPGHQQARMGL
ncbi:hypothetical protein BDW71DRAFT_175591, partial [Aspergillus fruticulosus]